VTGLHIATEYEIHVQTNGQPTFSAQQKCPE